MRQRGRIKAWLDSGYGFIALDCNGPDVFAHCSDLARGAGLIPIVGEGLTCEVESTPKGLRARHVEFEADNLA